MPALQKERELCASPSKCRVDAARENCGFLSFATRERIHERDLPLDIEMNLGMEPSQPLVFLESSILPTLDPNAAAATECNASQPTRAGIKRATPESFWTNRLSIVRFAAKTFPLGASAPGNGITLNVSSSPCRPLYEREPEKTRRTFDSVIICLVVFSHPSLTDYRIGIREGGDEASHHHGHIEITGVSSRFAPNQVTDNLCSSTTTTSCLDPID